MNRMFQIGARVRLIEAIDIFNVGAFPAHAAGTVILFDEPLDYALIKMDDHFADLDTWDNCLYVWASPEYEIHEAMFEPCGF
jgi:hypothetical protein